MTIEPKKLQNIENADTEELTKRIALLHSDLMGCIKTGLDKAIEIGGLLTHAKKKIISFGQFGEYCKTLPFSERTAQNYMRVYKNRESAKNASISDLNSFYEFLKVPLEQEEITSKQTSEITVQESEYPNENEVQTVIVNTVENAPETTQAISIRVPEEEREDFDYGEWHQNQAKTNSINNRALELCFALERQPLENLDNDPPWNDSGLAESNLKLVIDNMFLWIANGIKDIDGTKTVLLLTEWVKEAQKKHLSYQAKKEATDGETIPDSTETLEETEKMI